MKILVFADTHGNTEFMTEAIKQHMNDTDLIIHLGNNATDTLPINYLCGHIASIFILGNCDSPVKGAYSEHCFTAGDTGIRIFACHGHAYGVNNSTASLYMKGIHTRSRIVLYGHTHIAEISERDGIYIINPGSCSLPRGSEPPSYAIIRIEDDTIMPAIIFKKG